VPGANVLVLEAGPTPGLVAYVKTLLATGRYTRMIAVGMPIDDLSPLASFATDADLWAARLAAAGVSREKVELVRVPSLTRHRTAHKALAVKRYLDTHPARAIDLVSPSTHGRRSALIYERALKPTGVGILSAPQPYDMKRWWNSSAGVRAVIGELIALGYFCVGRDEVAQARESWEQIPAAARVVTGPAPERRD